MDEVTYEDPMDLAHWANSHEMPLSDGQTLPAIGGPVDGQRFAVPMMFGQLVPQFMRIRNVYQLHLQFMRWKFAFHIGLNWPGYKPEFALTERPAWRGRV